MATKLQNTLKPVIQRALGEKFVLESTRCWITQWKAHRKIVPQNENQCRNTQGNRLHRCPIRQILLYILLSYIFTLVSTVTHVLAAGVISSFFTLAATGSGSFRVICFRSLSERLWGLWLNVRVISPKQRLGSKPGCTE